MSEIHRDTIIVLSSLLPDYENNLFKFIFKKALLFSFSKKVNIFTIF